MSFLTKYQLMTMGQVPPAVIAAWLLDQLFAAYVARERRRSAALAL